jgi:hypothetical protein
MAAADLDTINSTQTQGVQNLGKIYEALLGKNQLNLVPVPAAVGSNGTAGQVAANATHLYLCVANNTWRRVALSTF